MRSRRFAQIYPADYRKYLIKINATIFWAQIMQIITRYEEQVCVICAFKEIYLRNIITFQNPGGYLCDLREATPVAHKKFTTSVLTQSSR